MGYDISPTTRIRRLLHSLPVRLAVDLHRWLWWIAGGLVVFLLALHLVLRFVVVPQIAERRQEIESALSTAIQRPVRLGQVRAGWSQFRPRVDIESLAILGQDGTPSVVLPAISASLSWRSITARTLVFGRLHTAGLELFLRRMADGTILLGDIPLNRGEDSGFIEWLQQQRGIDLEHSVIHWDDEARGAPRLTLREVDLRIRNRSGLHRFALYATPPASLAAPVDIRGEWLGTSVAQPEDGHGRLYSRLERLDLRAIRTWLEVPLGVTDGSGDLRVWLDLQDGRLAGATADVELSGLRARLDGGEGELALRALGGRVAMVDRPDRRALELQRLTLQGADGVIAPQTTLSWLQEGRGDKIQSALRIERVVLGPLARAALAFPLPDALRSLLRDAAPRGELRDLQAKWRGDWNEPRTYSLRGRLVELGAAPVAGLPGFDRVSGVVEAGESGGRVSLELGTMAMPWPGQFRRAIPIRSAEAVLDWRREGAGWRYQLMRARIDTGELQASLSGNWSPAARDLRLDTRIERMDAGSVTHYLPESSGSATREWLQTAFPSGGTLSGEARLRGDPALFPFAGSKGGQFEADLDLRIPSLLFSPRWPRLQAVEGRLHFRDAGVSAKDARARWGASTLEKVRLSISDLYAEDPVLDVSARVNATVSEVLDYIQTSPVHGLINGATDGMTGTGKVGLDLALKVPLNHSVDTTVKGDAAIDATRLDLGAGSPTLTTLKGRLLFDERGVRSPGLSADLLGGPARGVISSQPGGLVRIEASGRARIANLARQFPLKAWGLASGEAAWQGNISLSAGGTRLLVQSGLEGVALDLPAPLAKSSAQTLPLRMLWQSGDHGDRYEIDIGTQIRARLHTRSAVGGSAVDKALVALGAAALPTERQKGVALSADLPQFFATQWLPVIDRFAGSTHSSGPVLPIEARVRARRFELLGQFLGDTELTLQRPSSVWSWTVRGADAEGSGQWDPSGRGAVTARLSRLSLGNPVDGLSAAQEEDSAEYPSLDIEIGNLQRRGKDYGQLRLRASQQGRDWKIDQLRLSAAEYQLEATGVWQAWRSRPATDVQLELKTTDSGRYLERLGYGSLLKAAPAKLGGKVRWRGPPADLDLASLSGRLQLETGKGQFLKADPGAARLLGILSLQALPRRIALDFRDVFSDGLAFDSIDGELVINEGVIRSDPLLIDSPSAKVRIKGQVDLSKETQDLQVRVSPAMDVATLGALIANPVAGLAVFLAKQLLDDPLGKLITFEYQVSGSWSDPQVMRRGAPEVSNRRNGESDSPTKAPGALPGGSP